MVVVIGLDKLRITKVDTILPKWTQQTLPRNSSTRRIKRKRIETWGEKNIGFFPMNGTSHKHRIIKKI